MLSHKIISYNKAELPDYAAELLVMGECSLFLEAGSMEQEGNIRLSYLTEGFRALNTIPEFSTDELLSIAVSLLRGVRQSEKHCIFAEQFRIEEDCVFTDCSISRVKMIFMPAWDFEAAEKKIARLLEALAERGSEEGAGYIEKAVSLLESNAYGFKALLHHLEKLRREVYLCGIK